MFGRSRANKGAIKQSKSESKTERREVVKKSKKETRKGRGKRARETIREGHQTPVKTKTQPIAKNAGPPLRINGGSAKKHVTGTTPEEVVRNNRRKKR